MTTEELAAAFGSTACNHKAAFPKATQLQGWSMKVMLIPHQRSHRWVIARARAALSSAMQLGARASSSAAVMNFR